MAVLTRAQRLNWLDTVVPEDELLRPMPMGNFRVREDSRTWIGRVARVLARSREFAALTGAETEFLRG
jgi:putative SOS response-associated peptidase YedK